MAGQEIQSHLYWFPSAQAFGDWIIWSSVVEYQSKNYWDKRTTIIDWLKQFSLLNFPIYEQTAFDTKEPVNRNSKSIYNTMSDSKIHLKKEIDSFYFQLYAYII